MAIPRNHPPKTKDKSHGNAHEKNKHFFTHVRIRGALIALFLLSCGAPMNFFGNNPRVLWIFPVSTCLLILYGAHVYISGLIEAKEGLVKPSNLVDSDPIDGGNVVNSESQTGGFTGINSGTVIFNQSPPQPKDTDFLLPGNEPTPSFLQDSVNRGYFALVSGGAAVITNKFPHDFIIQHGEAMMTLGMENGELWISVKAFDQKGIAIVQVIRNRITLNRDNFFSIDKTDSRLILNDKHLKPIIDLRFLNPHIFTLDGRFYLDNGVMFYTTKDSLHVTPSTGPGPKSGAINLVNCVIGVINI